MTLASQDPTGPSPNATAGGPAGEPPAASGLGSAAPRAPDRAG